MGYLHLFLTALSDDTNFHKSLKQNGSVEGVRGKGRPKNSLMGVVDKCLKSKNIRSIKCKRKCHKNIMSVKEAS
jgi:hypothetical protein